MEVVAAPCRRIAELTALREAGRWGSRWTHIRSRPTRVSTRTFSGSPGALEADYDDSSSPRTNRPISGASTAATPSSSSAQHEATPPTNPRVEGKTFHRINGQPALSIPPFMRAKQWTNKSPFERAIKNPRPKIEGAYTEGNKKTLRIKLKEAQFATRMRENPYAHMLAEPVREDRFSQQRLPRPCMLRFQVVVDEAPTPTLAKPSESQSKETPRSSESSLVFLPLSLMGEALPKSKAQHLLTTKERAAVAALHNDTAFTPHGPGSHLLARYDLLAWVSADRKQGRLQRVLSTRARDKLDEASPWRQSAELKSASVVWQPDMPELVLAALRKAVRRLLAFMLRSKTSRPDRPGIVREVPLAPAGAVSLAMLDKVDGVACVLRMGAAAVPAARRAQLHPPQHVETQWEVQERGSFLDGLKALPACDEAVDARWPTLRYRNRRVMMYNLPALLGGHEQVGKLVAGTVFEQSEWVTVQSSMGTVELLQWLFRLHGYLAHGQGKQPATTHT